MESAVRLVDAAYGALSVIADGKRLAEFIPVGLSQDEIEGIRSLARSGARPARPADR